MFCFCHSIGAEHNKATYTYMEVTQIGENRWGKLTWFQYCHWARHGNRGTWVVTNAMKLETCTSLACNLETNN